MTITEMVPTADQDTSLLTYGLAKAIYLSVIYYIGHLLMSKCLIY